MVRVQLSDMGKVFVTDSSGERFPALEGVGKFNCPRCGEQASFCSQIDVALLELGGGDATFFRASDMASLAVTCAFEHRCPPWWKKAWAAAKAWLKRKEA